MEQELTTLKESNTALDAYPVGSIYIGTSATNPGEIFGGTWEAYGAGRTLVGVGTGIDDNSTSKEFAAGSTGGAYTHTLTTAQLPSHNHAFTAVTGTSTTQACYFPTQKYSGLVCNKVMVHLTESLSVISSFSIRNVLSAATTSNTSTNATGSGTAHNIIQPYIATYMWKRVA